MSKAYKLGYQRGYASGRDEATDRDWQWLADETAGAIQGTDPQDAVDFERGMHVGAWQSEDVHERDDLAQQIAGLDPASCESRKLARRIAALDELIRKRRRRNAAELRAR